MKPREEEETNIFSVSHAPHYPFLSSAYRCRFLFLFKSFIFLSPFFSFFRTMCVYIYREREIDRYTFHDLLSSDRNDINSFIPENRYSS